MDMCIDLSRLSIFHYIEYDEGNKEKCTTIPTYWLLLDVRGNKSCREKLCT